jgi:uncharacterized protein YneF (UPF0154 family)
VVEIIPRKAAPLPFWLKILFYVLVILLVGAILTFFILGHLQKKTLTELQNLEEEISQEKTPQKLSQEEEILSYQKKIKDFGLLAKSHFLPSKFFDFLERRSHPRIWISQISLAPGQAQVSLTGQAESFTALGQQIQILKRENLLKEINLTKISLGKKGEIEFTLDLSFDQKFFKP